MKKITLLLALLLCLSLPAWAGTVAPTETPAYFSFGQAFQNTWTPLTTTNPTGVAWDCRKVRAMSVFATGTWGGTSLALQGSVVSSSAGFVSLRALSTLTTIAITADSTIITVVFDTPVAWVKPVLTGGDGTTSITCTVLGVN